MTLQEYIAFAKTLLTERYDQREAQSLAWLIAEELAGVSRSDMALYPDRQLDRETLKTMQDAVEQVRTGRPVQYVLGKGWFCGLEFTTREGALIPRGETEELVEWIVDSHKGEPTPNILDIGTGSGAIAVALATKIKGAKITAVDISDEALAIARENAERHKAQIAFNLIDILVQSPEGEFDIIVSNPPYIPAAQAASMNENVVAHEPHTALFVPDNDPLLFYRTIAQKEGMLKSGGWIYFEINEQYSAEVCEMLVQTDYKDIEARNDIHDKPRMVRCRKA